jgi:hypothetical protein
VGTGVAFKAVAWLNALSASMRPCPYWLLGNVVSSVPPHVYPDGCKLAVSVVDKRIFLMSAYLSEGLTESKSATTPETWGAAIDVPLSVAYDLSSPIHAERTSSPGAVISGLISPATDGPILDPHASVSPLLVIPTEITFGLSPGELVVSHSPSLPLEKIGMIPAVCHALITAS